MHRYLISYGAQTLNGSGVYYGSANIAQDVPLAPEHIEKTGVNIQRACPEHIAAPWIVSIWKFED